MRSNTTVQLSTLLRRIVTQQPSLKIVAHAGLRRTMPLAEAANLTGNAHLTQPPATLVLCHAGKAMQLAICVYAGNIQK